MMTMMTFNSCTPKTSGIVETDVQDVVQAFHEKVANPPGTRANAAVYLLEPEVLQWLEQNPEVIDFSTQVLPNYLGRIATWHNAQIHRDIGTLESLREVQLDPKPQAVWGETDAWQQWFLEQPIHQQLKEDVA